MESLRFIFEQKMCDSPRSNKIILWGLNVREYLNNNNCLIMKYKITLYTIAACFMFACGGDDIDCADTTAVNTATTNAFQVVNTAITAFNNSAQETADCEALKSAYEDFIDELESVADCAVDVATDIQDARANLASLTCS